jgi:hypothetical protein
VAADPGGARGGEHRAGEHVERASLARACGMHERLIKALREYWRSARSFSGRE